ncbi:hypothetical protein FSP39_011517 [Pinctada imbricata]|uniref:hydroxyacylglutathione hydrolase n=1 Tax=Pinctada imbricata TaxID=66713 RepID=A0AA88YNR8_PINIB|nr:hypothetical protein FSP39_011517 [Pinctada imbricata]
MRVEIVPALEILDNYMYLIIDEETRECAVVDPVIPKKIMAALKKDNLKLTRILTTHHHWDHAGGNKELLKLIGPNLQVHGGDDRVEALTKQVHHNDELKVGNGVTVKCLHTPCHTTGHICFYATGPPGTEPAVFTGDTLFTAGCGYFFEGDAKDMCKAVDILSNLPQNTRVYPGHEYAVNNLKYAQHVEPDNQDIKKKKKWAEGERQKERPTIPTTISEEMMLNPFMRVKVDSVQRHAGKSDPINTMAFLRNEKNNFKG